LQFDPSLPYKVDVNGNTPLFHARDDSIPLFLSAGCNPRLLNSSGQHALFYQPQSACLLDSGLDLDLQDDEGRTPLIFAASYRNWQAVDKLINAGANTTIIDRRGRRYDDYFSEDECIIGITEYETPFEVGSAWDSDPESVDEPGDFYCESATDICSLSKLTVDTQA